MYEYKALLTKVSDGDTVDLLVSLGFHVSINIRVRLARINTPELNSTDPAERELAKQAKLRVQGLLINPACTITSQKPYPTDKYGRWIAEIVNTDGLNISDVLLQENLAKPY